MGNIANKLLRLSVARNNIIQALIEKHIDADGHGFEHFADDIANINSDIGLLTPHAFDAHNGYVSTGTFTWEANSPCFLDVYMLEANISYLISLGNTVGTRFRVMWSTTDTSTLTSAGQVKGTNILNLNNPPAHRNVTFIPTVDCYLTIQKDNLGQPRIPTYVFDYAKLCL